jgi:type IV secretion system protein VirB11
MHFEPIDLLSHDAMVTELFKPLSEFMSIQGATEISINRPYEVYVEAGPIWKRYDAPALSLAQCISLANAIASYTDQGIDSMRPLLTAQLPGGERIQIVMPPACERETVSMTIRIPDFNTRSFEDYEKQGFFGRYLWPRPIQLEQRRADLKAVDLKLIEHLENNRMGEFLKLAVKAKKNIAVVGDTGSGKTTFMKAVCQYIPRDERLITIEDVRELFLPNHGNRVHLLYSKGGQGTAKVTPAELIGANMRMKPDRVLLAELRGGEAFDFLKLLTTGHSGSITSFHAESCALADERYVFMCKEHEQAAIYDADALKRLVALTIDITIHVEVEKIYDDEGEPVRKERFISEVKFDPVAKLKTQFGDAVLHRA